MVVRYHFWVKFIASMEQGRGSFSQIAVEPRRPGAYQLAERHQLS